MKKVKKTERTCQTRRGCLNSVLMWRSTRSAATGCRRVGCRDSSATRSLLAGLEPSGSLVIHGDAPAPDRQGGLLLPLATGPNELRERAPRVAVQERDRAFRGQLALASEAHARAARCRSASLRPRRRCPPSDADAGAGRRPRALRGSGRSATPAGVRAPWRPTHRSRPASARAFCLIRHGILRRLDRRSGHVTPPPCLVAEIASPGLRNAECTPRSEPRP